MKKIFAILNLILLVSNASSSDSTFIKAGRNLGRLLTERIQKNSLNENQGHRGNNYVINFTDNQFSQLLRNNGGQFWNGINETEINQRIIENSPFFGSTKYYVVIASVFKYADASFDADNTVDWKTIQNNPSSVNLEELNNITGVSENIRKEYFQQLINYTHQNNPGLQQLGSDYLINYFFTVFTEYKGRFFVSYRTYISCSSNLKKLGIGLPIWDKELIEKNANRNEWIKKNIEQDAYWVDQYRKNDGDLTVQDYTRTLDGNKLGYLRDLFAGERKAFDQDGNERRNLKCKLILTSDQDNPVDSAKNSQYASLYKPPAGEMMIWLHVINGKPNIRLLKFGDEKIKAQFENSLRQLNHTVTFWEKFFEGWPTASLDDICSSLYEVMDWLSKKAGYLRIEEHIWNADHPDYKSIYGTAFSYVLTPVTIFGDKLISPLLQSTTLDINVCNFSQIQFAAVCGVWNGLVDAIKAIPDGIKLLASAGTDNPDHKDWPILSDAIKEKGGGLSGFGKLIWEGLKDAHSLNSGCCKFAHQIGSDIFIIIAAYFTGGQSLSSSIFSGGARTLFLILDQYEIVGQLIGRTCGFTLKVSLNGAKRIILLTKPGRYAFQVIEEATGKVIKFKDVVTQVFRDLDWQLLQARQISDQFGNIYTVGFESPFLTSLGNANLKIKEFLKDGEGKAQKDALGNSLVIAGKEGSNAAEDNTIAVIKAESFADLKSAVYLKLTNAEVKSDLDRLSTTTQENILRALQLDPNLLKYVDENPSISKAWTQHKQTVTSEMLNEAENAALSADEATRAQIAELIEDSEKKLQFKLRMDLGKRFEEEIVLDALTSQSSAWYLNLKNKVQLEHSVNLDEYDLFKQVQLKYGGEDYFVADQLFVKYGKNVLGEDIIEDVIVIENKLKSTTNLTAPQNRAFQQTNYVVRSHDIRNLTQPANQLSYNTSISSVKWYKIYDNNDGTMISGIEKLK